jgi:hypothetical protein
VKLQGGNHFTWTNAVCVGQPLVASCLAAMPYAAVIDDYGFAFLNTYLKYDSDSLLAGSGAGLATGLAAYKAQP